MSHFVVSFMKDVLGDNGRQAEICQRILEIDAPTEGEAKEIAKQRFCKAERLGEWSLHADRIQVKSSPTPGYPTPRPGRRERPTSWPPPSG
jgi:hypothetical protein